MKTIELSKGIRTFVDDEDFAALSRYRWYAAERKSGYYAARSASVDYGRNLILMHRVILGAQDLISGENLMPGLYTDHRDGDTLNNTRTNLRLGRPALNGYNVDRRRVGSSKYKGVCWDAQHGKWLARIQVNKRGIHLGRFGSEEDAARAYDSAALKYAGSWARLNFP